MYTGFSLLHRLPVARVPQFYRPHLDLSFCRSWPRNPISAKSFVCANGASTIDRARFLYRQTDARLIEKSFSLGPTR